MDGTLHIHEPVVTGEVLRGRHAGQTELCVDPAAVITPSGWDFIRQQRLRLTRADAGHAQAAAPARDVAPTPRSQTPKTTIAEVLPPGSEAGVLARGRCDHPDRSYGCRTEEFGSGFVEPSSCSSCAVGRNAGQGSGCGGCNKAAGGAGAGGDLETLVQQLTDQIMARLGGRGGP